MLLQLLNIDQQNIYFSVINLCLGIFIKMYFSNNTIIFILYSACVFQNKDKNSYLIYFYNLLFFIFKGLPSSLLI